MGAIKSHIKDGEKTPGFIEKKYFSINRSFDYQSDSIDVNIHEISSRKEKVSMGKEVLRRYLFISLYERFGNYLINLIKKVPEEKMGFAFLNFFRYANREENRRFLDYIEVILKTSIKLRFLTEMQFKKLESLTKEFHSKINKILENDDDAKKEYVYVEMILPILKLMEFEARF